MKFEEIYEWTGTCGVYQVCIFVCLFTISFMMSDSASLIFPIARMPHFCRVPELASLSHALQKYIAIPGRGGTVGEGQEGGYSQCEMFAFNYSAFQLEDFLNWNRSERTEVEPRVVKCNQWIYEKTTFTATTVSRFDLVCSNEYLVPLIVTFFMCGLMFGGILSGTISDRFGRKKTVAIFMFIRLVGWALSISSLSYATTVSGRFISGVGLSGMHLPLLVLSVELVPFNQRAFIMIGSTIALSAGFIGQTVMAYVIRDDVKYQLAAMLPNVFLFLFLFILPESLRWLILKGRHDEANDVIRRYIAVNGRSISCTKAIDTRNIELGSKNTEEKNSGQVESAGCLLLLSRPQMRIRTLIINFTYFTTSIVYFALLLNVETFAGNIYINAMVSGALEIPARFVAIFLVDSRFLGRRLTNAGLLLLMAASSAIYIPLVLSGAGIASTAVSLIGKALATMSSSVLHIYTAELYPTQIRSLALGTTSISTRIGGMVAPYMGTPMIRLWKPLPFLIYAILGTIAGLLSLLLPETIGQSLMDTVEQTESGFNGKRSRNGDLGTTETGVALSVEGHSAAVSGRTEAAAAATITSETGAESASHKSSMPSPALNKFGDSAVATPK